MLNDATYGVGKQMLDALSLRQQTIAHNITNVNTKGYKSKQVTFEAELKEVMDSYNSPTSHTQRTAQDNKLREISPIIEESNSNLKMNVDGNNVDIDFEMANMAANQIQYETLIRQISGRINNYHYVIRGN